MVELIKRYPLISSIITLIVIGVGSNLLINQSEGSEVLISELPSEEISISEQQVPANDSVQVVEEVIPLSEPVPTTEVSKIDTQEEVPIYICGEVNQPGVYYVMPNAIIDDVVRLSGGFTDQADKTAVNLASPIAAHQKIIVPMKGEQIDKLIESYDNIEGNAEVPNNSDSNMSTIDYVADTHSTCVNINTASKEILMSLPGIGEVKATAIIAYRQEYGRFNTKEELKNVSGIGDKTYEKLAQLITI